MKRNTVQRLELALTRLRLAMGYGGPNHRFWQYGWRQAVAAYTARSQAERLV